MRIFRRPTGHMLLRRPKERERSHRSLRLHQMWGDFEVSRLQHRIGLGRSDSTEQPSIKVVTVIYRYQLRRTLKVLTLFPEIIAFSLTLPMMISMG